MKPPATPIVTGLAGKDPLGKEVDKILNQSQHLRELWAQAKSNGWKIEFSKEGKSQAIETTRTVTINLNDVKTQGAGRAAQIASLLAHEIGHAGTPYTPRPRGTTEDEYAERNVEQALRHEGEAAMANLIAREEIRGVGGPDIGVRGGLDEFYLDVYERFKQGPPAPGLTRDDAISLLSEFMAAEPQLEDGTNKEEYLENYFRGEWQRAHNPGSFL